MTTDDQNMERNDPPALTQGRGYVFPFMLDHGIARGRLVRLGEEFFEATDHHGYPHCVNVTLGELLAFGASLVADLKTQGILTLQITQGRQIPMIVAEVSSEGDIRGCANFDADQLNHFLKDHPHPTFKDLFDGGQFVLTTRFIHTNEMHQAIIEINGDTLADVMGHYFDQSAQIPTEILIFSNFKATLENSPQIDSNVVDLATKQSFNRANFSIAAVLLQKMPLSMIQQENITKDELAHQADDYWTTYHTLLQTLTEKEALSGTLTPDMLLHRLFHQHHITVFPTKPIHFQCSCSKGRLETVLKTFDETALDDMVIDGIIEAGCQFCGAIYRFSKADILSLDPL